jgi:predicted nucleotidyltransferase
MKRNNKTPELIELLIDKIKKDYFEDISIIYLYGSYLNEDFHELSDIDLFIVTKSDKGYKLGFTFILNGIGYDF